MINIKEMKDIPLKCTVMLLKELECMIIFNIDKEVCSLLE